MDSRFDDHGSPKPAQQGYSGKLVPHNEIAFSKVEEISVHCVALQARKMHPDLIEGLSIFVRDLRLAAFHFPSASVTCGQSAVGGVVTRFAGPPTAPGLEEGASLVGNESSDCSRRSES